MKVTIHPSQLKGTVQAPASKSSMQRACAAALLIKGTSIIHNPGTSNDDKAALKIIQQLGATVKINKNAITIDSIGLSESPSVSPSRKGDSSAGSNGMGIINCGESGLGIRMFTPIVALTHQEITITGEGSLLSRPMEIFDAILPQLGVRIRSNAGKLPLFVKGPLQPANIEIDGSLSSQFLTGLLLSYSAAGAKDVTIKVKNLKSKPYIALTLDVMKKFGMNIPENKNYEEFIFHNEPAQDSQLKSRDYTVEGDWSGAAFLLAAGAIAGPITVRGLDLTSTQPDKAIVDILINANAGIAIEAKGIKIHPSEMKGFVFDATDCPDLFPPLVALAAYCKGRVTLKGVHRLAHKESNRALTLQEEFDKMGVLIKLERDEMIIQGNGNVKGADIDSHMDHRVAMACSIAALKATGETVIEGAEAVNKSYPDFYKHIKYLGAEIQQ